MKYKRIPFDTKYQEEIEYGDYEVETRDGRKAVIYEWHDNDKDYPIIAKVWDHRGRLPLNIYYMNNGRHLPEEECALDLFIVTNEPDVDFKTHLADIIYNYSEHEVSDVELDKLSAELLSLAKEEIKNELPMWKKGAARSYPYISDNHELRIDGWWIRIRDLENGLPYEKLDKEDYEY